MVINQTANNSVLHSQVKSTGGCRGCDRMVVGFTTTYAISSYHHWCCEFESRSGRGVQHYVIKFDRSVVFSGSSINKTDRHDITAILLKVALNTIKQTIKSTFYFHTKIVPYIFHINHLFWKRSLEDILHPIFLKFSTLKAELISLF